MAFPHNLLPPNASVWLSHGQLVVRPCTGPCDDLPCDPVQRQDNEGTCARQRPNLIEVTYPVQWPNQGHEWLHQCSAPPQEAKKVCTPQCHLIRLPTNVRWVIQVRETIVYLRSLEKWNDKFKADSKQEDQKQQHEKQFVKQRVALHKRDTVTATSALSN